MRQKKKTHIKSHLTPWKRDLVSNSIDVNPETQLVNHGQTFSFDLCIEFNFHIIPKPQHCHTYRDISSEKSKGSQSLSPSHIANRNARD